MNEPGEMIFSHVFKETRKYRKYYQDTKLVDEILSYFETHDELTYSVAYAAPQLRH